MSNLVNFIKSHENWENLLKEDPYKLTITKSEEFPELRLFKYIQGASDYSNPIVKESRGIIINVESFEIVCWPFDKFFNYMEPNADKIDWDSAVVQEKLDGSIIKLFFYKGFWRIATNGTINANTTQLPHNPELTFGPLVERALMVQNFDFNTLLVGNTYIFEFVSRWNKIVINYGEDYIYHIGTRMNDSGNEYNFANIGIKKPAEYPLYSLDACLKAAENLPFSKEGYVVVDKDFKRIKVKGLKYIAAHRLKGITGYVDMNRLLEIHKMSEEDEFLGYFPEYEEDMKKVQHLWDVFQLFIKGLEKYNGFKALSLTRKEIALRIQKEVPKPFQHFAYEILDGRELNFDKVSMSLLKDQFEI